MSAFERRYPVAHGLPRARPSARSASSESLPPPSVSRTARLLVLAHAIDRLCETEKAGTDYAHVARRLGMTRARVTQVLNLLHLSPVIQEAILDGGTVVSERALRSIVQDADWERQSNAITDSDSNALSVLKAAYCEQRPRI